MTAALMTFVRLCQQPPVRDAAASFSQRRRNLSRGCGLRASLPPASFRRVGRREARVIEVSSMAKKPVSIGASAPQVPGETPDKSSPLPEDALVALSYTERQGEGGETRQAAEGEMPILTTQQGIPIADDQNSLRQGPRGPTLLEDF